MEYRISDVYSSILHKPCPSEHGITYMECDAKIALLGNTMEGSTSYYSFNIVCEGSMDVVMSSGTIRLCKNDLFIYPPGIQFKVRDVSKDYRCISIVADEFFIQDIPQIRRLIGASYIPLLTTKGKSTPLSDDEICSLRTRMEEIKSYIEKKSIYKEQFLQFEYALLVVEILDVQSRKKESAGMLPEGTQKMLIEFLRLLQLHFREHHNITFYADKLNVTPIYLSRVIKKATGRTVMSFVNQILGIEASNLLAHTDKPVSDIARILNFADSASFCKFFVRQMQIPPRQYRKSKMLSKPKLVLSEP